MATLVDNNNGTPISGAQPIKHRRKKSIVWEHFTIETVDGNCTRAFCKQCKKSFAYITGSKLAGTSHLKRHIALGICPVSRLNQEKNQLFLRTPDSKSNGSQDAVDRPRKRRRPANTHASFSFDQERCSHEMAKMIIQHDYPLHMVEHSGFVGFANTLNPHYSAVNMNTIQDHIVRIYLGEKQNLLNILAGIHGRVSLSLDLWTSDQTVGYAIITGQFVDCEWKLHRRVLSVITLLLPDSEYALRDAVNACLKDWCLKSKLFALTLNQPFSSENVRSNLISLLSVQKTDILNENSVILDGQLIIVSCYARVLSSLAQDALEMMRETVEKVRRSVKCVIVSESHQEKFTQVKQQLQVPSTKTLILDEKNSWNTTYEMLLAASELKEVFSCLDIFGSDNVLTPSVDEWRQVQTLCTYLKFLYDAVSILTTETYPTSNTFFHEVWKIQLELMNAAMSQDLVISNLTKPLKDKFERYWKDCFLILAVAAVMDPRCKMQFVEIRLSRIYGEGADTWMKSVDKGLHELYHEYFFQPPPPSGLPAFVEEDNESVIKPELYADYGLVDFDFCVYDFVKSELDLYLEEPAMPHVQDFDVLGWWRENRMKYPTLSNMASDVLSIPVSSVLPDSVFHTAEGKMDSLRSNLRPSTVEALFCAKDWLKYGCLDFDSLDQTEIVKMDCEAYRY